MADAPTEPNRAGPDEVEPPASPPSSALSTAPVSIAVPLPSLTSSPASPPGPGAALTAVLADARRLLQRAVALEALVAGVAGLVAAALIAVVVIGVVPFSQLLRLGLLAFIAVGGAAGVSHVLWHRGRVLRHDVVIAARLAEALRRRGQDIGDGLRSAVELRDSAVDSRLGRSRALCDAHIARAVDVVRDGHAADSLNAVALERAVPTMLGTAAVGAVLLLALAAAHDVVGTRLARLLSAEAAAVALAERAAAEPPLVTDITLTLRFPAYMARADEVIPGAAGDVTAPRGTEVTVVGRADRSVDGAALIVTGGPQELTLQAAVDGDRVVRGQFTVMAPGAWRFVLRSRGDERIDPVARKILVKADAAPVVRLEAPTEDKTVKVDDEVALLYAAEDDVGVTKVRVVVKRQGSAREPYSKDLADVATLRTTAGSGSFRIEDTGARPGEKLAVTIEALDNDAVSGPNVGRSVTRVLTVFSASAHHKEVIDRLDALLVQMVEILGDELEGAIADVADGPLQKRTIERHKQLAPRAAAMMKAFDETLAAVADDTLFGAGDDAVRRALANMRLELSRAVDAKAAAVERAPPVADKALPLGIWRRLVDAQRGLVNRLESDIIYLEDLLQLERVREAKQLVEDVKQAQQDLKALLTQFKESGDDASRQALLDEIKRMQQQLAALAARLGELRREVPDEFLNEDAFKADEMFDKAQSLDEMIEEGRLEDAAKALEAMLESTEKMIDELGEAEDEVGGPESKALREKVERFGEELAALEKAQQESLKETEAIMDRAKNRAEERFAGKMKAALAEARKKAEQATEALRKVDAEAADLNRYEEEDHDTAVARTDDLKRALDSGDIDDALQAAEEAESAARNAEESLSGRQRRRGVFSSPAAKKATQALSDAASALREAREKLDAAMPDASEMLDGKDRDKLARQAERQGQLGEQAQKLAEQMAEIGKEAPIFGPQHSEQMQGAKDAMERARDRLAGQARPRPDRGGLRQGRQAQSQALQQLQGLRESLEQMGKGQGQGGMPMPLPGGGSPGSERSDREGRGGRDDVKIPDGSEFKVKDAFRKDILDAMRETAPGEWAGEVKRYYEELIK